MDENYKTYLSLIVLLLIFYIVIVVYLKNTTQQSFGEVTPSPSPEPVKVNQDTRYQFPLTPPVNPMIYRTEIINGSVANSDLYTNQDYSSEYKILGDNNSQDTNQLDYSGGSCSLIKIPLQMNEPYNEQLRSQDVLITPYNRVKYSNKEC